MATEASTAAMETVEEAQGVLPNRAVVPLLRLYDVI
jgi:hypothetical protein